jgi:hypothetical protein
MGSVPYAAFAPAVPEPASYALMLSGAAGVVLLAKATQGECAAGLLTRRQVKAALSGINGRFWSPLQGDGDDSKREVSPVRGCPPGRRVCAHIVA